MFQLLPNAVETEHYLVHNYSKHDTKDMCFEVQYTKIWFITRLICQEPASNLTWRLATTQKHSTAGVFVVQLKGDMPDRLERNAACNRTAIC